MRNKLSDINSMFFVSGRPVRGKKKMKLKRLPSSGKRVFVYESYWGPSEYGSSGVLRVQFDAETFSNVDLFDESSLDSWFLVDFHKQKDKSYLAKSAFRFELFK